MSARRRPIVVLGLDAADPGLLRGWAATGALPTLARLLAEGTAAATRNPPGLYVGAVWPSLFTGVSPTRHGRYCYDQLVPGTYGVRRFAGADYRVEPFWAALARAGARVTTVDVPKSPPPAAGDGVHVVDWGTHDPGAAGFCTAPAALAGEIRARHGVEPVGGCDAYGADPESVRALRDRLLARIERKTALLLDLLGGAPSDLFFGVFTETHCAGHQLWRQHDAAHPRHDADIRRALGDPVETVYRALDAALARVLAALPPDTTVIVVASHGMGSHYDANHLLADMLSSLDAAPARLAVVGRLQRAWHALPAGVRAALAPPLVRAGRRLSGRRAGAPPGLASALRAPDPSRLPYFAVPNNDCHGGIRLNLAGREPAGPVRPEGVERTVAELRVRLATFINEETGRPVVAAIHRIADLYPGEDVGALPDLIVDWDRSAPVRALRSPRYGRLVRETPSPRSGDHRPDGLLIARGPGIAPGRTLAPVASVALAATISHLLGVDRLDLDGHPIAALCAPTAA